MAEVSLFAALASLAVKSGHVSLTIVSLGSPETSSSV